MRALEDWQMLAVLICRRALEIRMAEDKLLMPYELIYLKIISSDQRIMLPKHRQESSDKLQPTEIVGTLLNSINVVSPEMGVSNLETIRQPEKQMGLYRNYIQILKNISPISLSRKNMQFKTEALLLRKQLVIALKTASKDYTEVAPRDLCELVVCLSTIKYKV
jgi:hypothetical protein